VFERPQTVESAPSRAAADFVGLVEFPPGRCVASVLAPNGSDASLFKGLEVSRSVAFGSTSVELELDLPDTDQPLFGMGAFARRKRGTLVVDIISVTYGPHRYYGDVYHHRVVIEVPSGLSTYTRTRLGRQLCTPIVSGQFRPDGRLEVVVHQEAMRGCFLLPIPLGMMAKTSLLVEKQLPFGVDDGAVSPRPEG
jgi:hypothetical protein